jgi:hypothetical protein
MLCSFGTFFLVLASWPKKNLATLFLKCDKVTTDKVGCLVIIYNGCQFNAAIDQAGQIVNGSRDNKAIYSAKRFFPFASRVTGLGEFSLIRRILVWIVS